MKRTKNFTRNFDVVDTTSKQPMWRRQRQDDGGLQSAFQVLRMTGTENKLPVCRRRGLPSWCLRSLIACNYLALALVIAVSLLLERSNCLKITMVRRLRYSSYFLRSCPYSRRSWGGEWGGVREFCIIFINLNQDNLKMGSATKRVVVCNVCMYFEMASRSASS